MKPDRACRQHIVLLGMGHTNAHVVRMWAMNPLPDTDLTCISNSSVATYSGFLPAVLTGQLPPEAMEIDLVRLCTAAGARLITESVTGLDRGRQLLLFSERPPVPWDVLSVGIGSVPLLPECGTDSTALTTVKPMSSFISRLSTAVGRLDTLSEPIQVIIAGGGVAGVEVTMCLPERLKTMTSHDFHITLINRGQELLPGCTSGTRHRIHRILEQRNATVLNNNSVTQVGQSTVKLQPDRNLPADIVIWATSATAPALLSSFDLPKDDRGFLLTDDTLKSTGGDPIFAVGDTGTIDGREIPKAGVYAVRQGPILWENIQRQLNGRSLIPYVPQSSFLKLLNTGDGRAVGEWRGFSFEGRWAMQLKQRIDQRFMDKYQLLPDRMEMPDEMQCRGCGCKLGGDALETAIGGNESTRDDATAIPLGANDSVRDEVLVTTDFFSAPFPDAWLNGRITAIHSASDIYAMGALPFAAEAIMVLPDGDETTQQQMLHDFQSGASREFERMGATITGGHTITGPRWEAGFTVFGRPAGKQLIRKRGLVAGDQLYLTKPLGSGVLMAALMRGQCARCDYESMIDIMLRDNHETTLIAIACGVVAGTDVTGFGLLGHLHEMLTDDVRIRLSWNSIPLLPGAYAAAEQGIASSLLPANRCYLRGVVSDRMDSLDLLLDPQTCGGLLLSVPASKSSEFSHRFAVRNLPEPAEIGVVLSADSGESPIDVRF